LLSVGLARASSYQRRQPARPWTPRSPKAPSPQALGPTERQAVLEPLHSERFVDQNAGRSPCDLARRADLSMLAAHDGSRAGRGRRSPWTARL